LPLISTPKNADYRAHFCGVRPWGSHWVILPHAVPVARKSRRQVAEATAERPAERVIIFIDRWCMGGGNSFLE